MLASQAEIGVWVKAPEALAGVRESPLEKFFRMHNAKSCSQVHFVILKHFNNGNAVPMRSDSFLTR